jgi:Acyl-CoA dehydrogenase, C-terminal domain
MSHADLTADEAAALRDSVQTSIARLGDAEAVAENIGALDLFDDALPSLAVFFEEFGRHHLVSTLIDTLVAHTLGLEGTAVAYALPRRGLVDPSGAVRAGSGLRVDAVLRAPRALPSKAVVSLDEGAVVVPMSQLRTTAVAGFDRDGAWQRIRGELPDAEVTAVDAADWARAVALARVSLGSEILGVAIEINAIAIEHVTARHQFGKPLGSFQTVRHRLAEAHVAIQAAQTLLNLGWTAAATSTVTANDVAVYAVAAKAAAGRAFEAASRTANQVCGGLGLTAEHSLPVLVRRGSALNVLLGDPTDLTAAIGHALCAAEPMPLPDPLASHDDRVGAH